MFKSKLLHKTKICSHGLSHLLIQNPYSKFILAIKTLIFDRFSKLLHVLLRQNEIQMLNRKYLPCLPAVKNSRQKFIIRGQFLHFTLVESTAHPDLWILKTFVSQASWKINSIAVVTSISPFSELQLDWAMFEA